ncbi:class I SAM-dependent methyltransferase [Sphingomonas immobilis]|uniref:Class I SAM-dependent methyltransferase n=1 Tax=Sphingomonas immobilis TaxID=3063997 RepID=A0ABT8ZZ76_9SPHN|nr:class I SAM-dependent methyltransferase [Sphingomonas sp. CA1-15]MDO7842881.1 class I SAM-dependent methyltransferase [Sphingomonas sp. CA1-15]
MKPIDLGGFDRKFASDDDPWCTFSDRAEARKRRAILHGVGEGPIGRVLELAAGNGSNSVALAKVARRLDATEGTQNGTDLVKRAVGDMPRVQVRRLVLPGRFPRQTYDTIVVAEVLYYLTKTDMTRVARDVTRALRPGGRLILAHHRVDFPDFLQHADGLHHVFLTATGSAWREVVRVRTGRWSVQSFKNSIPRALP